MSLNSQHCSQLNQKNESCLSSDFLKYLLQSQEVEVDINKRITTFNLFLLSLLFKYR